jgi:hypothetical protein
MPDRFTANEQEPDSCGLVHSKSLTAKNCYSPEVSGSFVPSFLTCTAKTTSRLTVAPSRFFCFCSRSWVSTPPMYFAALRQFGAFDAFRTLADQVDTMPDCLFFGGLLYYCCDAVLASSAVPGTVTDDERGNPSAGGFSPVRGDSGKGSEQAGKISMATWPSFKKGARSEQSPASTRISSLAAEAVVFLIFR